MQIPNTCLPAGRNPNMLIYKQSSLFCFGYLDFENLILFDIYDLEFGIYQSAVFLHFGLAFFKRGYTFLHFNKPVFLINITHFRRKYPGLLFIKHNVGNNDDHISFVG